jgi:cell wall-associated NlpC family hydrolase
MRRSREVTATRVAGLTGVLAAAMLILSAAAPAPAATASTPTPPQLVTHVPVARGCFVVAPWLAGVKVFLVQRALHVRGHRERYDAATATAVRRWQAEQGLPVTGRVDRAAWRALHPGRRFCVDRYTAQPALSLDATPKARRRAMTQFARAQVGRRYIWGGAGPIGYDCSGLALQAMHAAGLSIPAITTADHQHSAFPSGAVLYHSAGLRRFAFAQRRSGDLIFWSTPGAPAGSIEHVAIYLGHGRIVEAVRPRIRVSSVWSHSDLLRKPRVVRPFPG